MEKVRFGRKIFRTAISLILLSFVPVLNGFDRPAGADDSIAASLLEYYKNFPVEKVYVQTDRSRYSPLQVVWFKMYAEGYGLPSKISQVGYVQLVNRSGKVILTQKLLLADGACAGNLQLPDSLKDDVYQLRGFTAWMLNFDESGIFHKDILVGNLSTQSMPAAATTGQGSEVQFFPEGGDMVSGIMSQVAFIARNAQGLPVNVTGIVKDDAGTQVGSLNVVHDGMGKFQFIPSAAHHYSAEIHFPDGSIRRAALPEVKPFGVSLHVTDQTPDLINLRIVCREKNQGDYRNLQLAAFQSSGKVSVYPIDLDPGVNLFDIHKKGFATGILNLTVLDGEMPLAERLVFLHVDDQVRPDIVGDTLSFEPRSKSAFTIHLNGPSMHGDNADLSVSVTDADQVKPDLSPGDIMSALLTDPELEGGVYDPASYFGADTQESAQALDLLMMTHRWRQFSWKEVFAKNPSLPSHPAERSLFLSGRVENAGKHPIKPGTAIELTFRNQDFSVFNRSVVPDAEGNFRVDDLVAYGDCSIVLPSDDIPKGSRVEFYHSFVDSMTSAPFYNLPLALPEWRSGAGQSPEAAASGSPDSRSMRRELTTEYVGYPLYGSKFEDYNLSTHSFAASTRLFDWLRGRFPGLEVQGIETNPRFYLDRLQINTAATSSQLEGKANPLDTLNSEPYYYTENVPGNDLPYFYVNEIPVSFDVAKNIPLTDISFIRYFRPPVRFMPPGTALLGVIAIYTKQADESGAVTEGDHNVTGVFFKGFSINRPYYQVRYRPGAKPIGDPDVRATLYWNPHLAAGENGDFHFSFFNSDRAKRFRIIVEGIDDQGRIIHLNKIIAAK